MRKYNFLILMAALVMIIASACSTAKVRVMAGEDGTNRVVSRDIERDGAEEASYKAAESYCKDQGKRTVYIDNAKNDTQYTGTMDEGTRKTVRGLSKAAFLLGPMAGVGAQNSALGTGIGGAGMAGTMMTSDRDYKSEIKFKCQ